MKRWIVLAVLAQLAVLGWMAGQREWLLATGTRVWLRTAPVDPRDLFRGDYVRLGYEIDRLDPTLFGPALRQRLAAQRTAQADGEELIVHVALATVGDRAVARSVDLVRPGGPAIRGRARIAGTGAELQAGLRVDYGIDAWFVEQGTGLDLERGRPADAPEGMRIPLDMQVALSSSGEAALCGWRWSGLGIVARWVDNRPGRPREAGDPPGPIRVQLWNANDRPVVLLLPHDPALWLRLERDPATVPPLPVEAGGTVMIAPHTLHTFVIPAEAVARVAGPDRTTWWSPRLAIDLPAPPPEGVPAGAEPWQGRLETTVWWY